MMEELHRNTVGTQLAAYGEIHYRSITKASNEHSMPLAGRAISCRFHKAARSSLLSLQPSLVAAQDTDEGKYDG